MVIVTQLFALDRFGNWKSINSRWTDLGTENQLFALDRFGNWNSTIPVGQIWELEINYSRFDSHMIIRDLLRKLTRTMLTISSQLSVVYIPLNGGVFRYLARQPW